MSTAQSPGIAGRESSRPAEETPHEPDKTGKEEKGEDVDVEALARRVYKELKRRLAVEWERARGGAPGR
jgi:hypothetical protein